ncbi:MAG: hypothetical protein RLN86_08650 [Cyclobacteriaceae bacterium]
MRVIGSIPHEKCAITFFHWNNRYLIKIEAGPFEQTYKINEYDLGSEEDLKEIVDEDFIKQCLLRFQEMANSLGAALEKL